MSKPRKEIMVVTRGSHHGNFEPDNVRYLLDQDYKGAGLLRYSMADAKIEVLNADDRGSWLTDAQKEWIRQKVMEYPGGCVDKKLAFLRTLDITDPIPEKIIVTVEIDPKKAHTRYMDTVLSIPKKNGVNAVLMDMYNNINSDAMDVKVDVIK